MRRPHPLGALRAALGTGTVCQGATRYPALASRQTPTAEELPCPSRRIVGALDELCVNTIRTLSMDARAEGELGAPGHADGARAAGLPPLHARHAPRAGAAGLAGPRPLRALLRARVDAPLLDPVPHGLRADARRPQELPPARLAVPPGTPSTATPPASRPPPARSARASPPRSASRSPSACSPRASTARATRSSTTTRT